MAETSTSLLHALCVNSDRQAWQRLLDVYGPWIRQWLHRQGLQPQDVDDVSQNVMTVVFRKLPEFERQRTGSFRRWLRVITVNCLREHGRKQRATARATGKSDFVDLMHQLEAPGSRLSRQWDYEHDQHITNHLLNQVRVEFRDTTWEAFNRVALAQESPNDVASDLNMTVNAVFIAKSRVLKRLRELGAGLID